MKIKRSGLSFQSNLTDSWLEESLVIQIIATFSKDAKNIYKALFRKRRPITIYEFTKLTIEKTNALLRKMNKEIQVIQEMTLADIFNLQGNFYEY